MADKKKLEESEADTMDKIKAVTELVSVRSVQLETVIPQATITILIVGAVVFLVVSGRVVPEWLLGVFFTIIGFYFGNLTAMRSLKVRTGKDGR
jgi:hypothetical protein